MYIQYFFFLIVFFEYKKHACKKIIQVYFINIVNPSSLFTLTCIYTKICEKDYRRI